MKDVHCRTAFISDVHLGTPGCQAELLLDFLDHLHCTSLYLVGDIVDLEALERRPWWHASHSAVLSRLRRLASDGTRLIYIPGNHDAPMRALAGLSIGDWLSIEHEAIHLAADGRRYRVSHGDEFDDERLDSDWRLVLGERLHRILCLGHRLANRLRRRLGRGYRPYTVEIKPRIPAVRRYIEHYAARVAADTAARGLDGHIGGHIHLGQVAMQGRVSLLNDGDWVEHCTALLEDHEGRFELRPWGRTGRRAELPRLTPAPGLAESGPSPHPVASAASLTATAGEG